MTFSVDCLREAFPALRVSVRKKPVIYFDNACMTLKPEPVLRAMDDYYRNFPGCHARADHLFGTETSRNYAEVRRKVAAFFNAADPCEIVFTRNATEGLNLLAYTLDLKAGDVVVSSDLEHNSNLLPWQALEKRRGVRRLIVSTRVDTIFDLDRFREQLTPAVRLVSVLHTSNLTGVVFPVADIVRIAHEHGALVCVDAAQAALARTIDVRALDVDFLVASAHKMWGPTGMGILYGKRALLEALPQFLTGGGTVEDVGYNSVTVNGLPDKFEAGLQNYAGAAGVGAAVDFIREVGQEAIAAQVCDLNARASELVAGMDGVTVLGPREAALRSGILNIVIDGLDAADAARVLHQSENIMVRFGKHCVHPWYASRRVPDSLRFSFGAYNTADEVDTAAAALRNVVKFFRQKAS
jgi:cysteine desulfurase/selenocysteine lyase